MDFRSLGASGLNVPAIGLGTANFRGGNNPDSGLGDRAAARLVDLAIERGAAFFDSSDIYGPAEEVLGKALGKRRTQVLIGTKAGLRCGPGPNDIGATRHHLIQACEASLRRLGTDYIDLFQIHSFDLRTPVEETLSALAALIQAGKVRYIGCSNYAGWQLMKSLSASDRHGWPRFVSHQIAMSLAVRDAEWELVPLGADQNVASLIWGPLAGGALSGLYGRSGQPLAGLTHTSATLATVPPGQMQQIIDCLGEVARESGAGEAQVALAWLLQRPTVATVFTGVSSAEQFEANLGALELHLTGDQLARLDEASARPAPFPFNLQRSYGAERIALPGGGGANVRVDRALPGTN
jgi:aryl-alcohol dehydrogenase-like predicted oxidoreductase